MEENDHLPELQESSEPEGKRKNGRYNLRKSLAWDSAFFTSAGVLDAEELSSMITGTDKTVKPPLPGIQEEITGSTESLSPLESDNLTLEACEDDLFLDIRASIQRSNKKASELRNSSSKKAAIEIDSVAISSLKKDVIVPQNKNPKLGLKKTSAPQTVSMSRVQTKQLGKVAPTAKVGGTNSVLPKPTKTTINPIPSSTATAKWESTGTVRPKSESSSKLGTIVGKGTQPSKISVLSGSRKALPKPAVPLKSSLLGSSTTSSVHSIRSSTSSDRSTNTSSGIPAKPTLMTARRNISKSGNISIAPSCSIPKTPSRVPSRVATKNKLPASNLSAYVKSAQIPSSVSPASSISDWSSVSSSSSMANQRSNNNSRNSLDTSSCKSMDGGPTAERHGKQGVLLASNVTKKSSTQAGVLQGPAKPSGLRMPSPTIGYFDGMKSPARTPNGCKQSESGLRTAFPKNGDTASITIQSSNSKLKSARVPTARTSTSLTNMKPASPKLALPLSTQEKVQASTISKEENDYFKSSLVANAAYAMVETCLKTEKVQVEDVIKQVADAGAAAVDGENFGDFCMPKNVCSMDNVETVSGSEYVKQMGDNVPTKMDHSKMDCEPLPICEAFEKEKDKEQGLSCELPSDTSECAISFSVVASEPTACRSLLSLKNTSESIDTEPWCIQEKSLATTFSKDVKDSHSSSLGTKDGATEETSPTLEKVQSEDIVEQVVDAGAGSLYKENYDDLSVLKNVVSVNNIITVSASEYVKQMGDNLPAKLDHSKMDCKPHPICEAIDKENNREQGLSCELPSDTSECAISFSVVISEHAACGSLLSLKNTSESFDTEPWSFQEKSLATTFSKDVKDSHNSSFGTKDGATEETSPRLEKVQSEAVVEQVADAGAGSLHKENFDDLSVLKNVVSVNNINTVSASEYVKQLGDNVPTKMDHSKMDCEPLPICEAIEKENDKEQGLSCELPSDTSEYALSFSLVASEPTACRSLLSLKNTSESIDTEPWSIQEKSLATIFSKDVKDSYNSSLGIKDCATEETSPRLEKVQSEDIVEQVADAGAGSLYEENFDDLSVLRNVVSVNNINTVSAIEYVKQMGDNLPAKLDHSKMDCKSHPICEAIEKENDRRQGLTCQSQSKAFRKAEKVQAEDGVKQVAGAGSGAIDKENLSDLCMLTNMDSEDKIKTISGSDCVNQMGASVLINQDHHKKDFESRLICEATEKEDDGRGICQDDQGLTCEVRSSTSECTLSFSVIASEPAVCRVQFIPENTSEAIGTSSCFIQERSHSVSKDENDPSNTSLGAKVNATEETCQKVERVQAEAQDDVTQEAYAGNDVDHMGDNVLVNQEYLPMDWESYPIGEAIEKDNDSRGEYLNDQVLTCKDQSGALECTVSFPDVASEPVSFSLKKTSETIDSSPLSIQEKSHTSVSKNVNDPSNSSPRLKGCATEETCPKSEKHHAEDGVKQEGDGGNKENFDDSNILKNMDSGDNIKIASDSDETGMGFSG